MSFLAILHIADRPRLLARLAGALWPDGGCFVEDLCQRAPFATTDLGLLRGVVCGLTVASLADYAADWAPFAAVRLAAWRQNHAAYAAVHGEGA